MSSASRIAFWLLLTGLLWLPCPCAFALDAALDVSQYAHTAWRIREGFSKGAITAIAQTPDGYLWLGTEFGLLRFDGVRNVTWRPPTGERLPGGAIHSLLSARDGSLWVGTDNGLAHWKDGKLTQYPELTGQYVFALLEDRGGTTWAGTGAFPSGRLCAIQSRSVQCFGKDGRLGLGVLSLYEDSGENLWAGASTGLWRWRPGPPKLYPIPGPTSEIGALTGGHNGALLIITVSGIRQLVKEKVEEYPLPATGRQFRPRQLLSDHNGGVWIGTTGEGLLHEHHGRVDWFTHSDGLSGDQIERLLEDREGNVWVVTTNGLDRFREFAVPTISVKQGLSSVDGVKSVLVVRDGSVWLTTNTGLNRWNNGQIKIYHPRSAQDGSGSSRRERERSGLDAANKGSAESAVHGVTDSGLPGRAEALFQDDRGRIWVSTTAGVVFLENERFIPVTGVPGGNLGPIAGDSEGDIWIANQDLGLSHLRGRSLIEQIPWASLGHQDPARALVADPVQGGLWLGFFNGGVAHFKNGQILASHAAADGLGTGHVNNLKLDQDGTLWAATEGGLSRLKNGRIATLTGKNGLPCDTVIWVIEDDARSFWLYMPCGLVRITRPELDAWLDDPKRTIEVTVFDGSDGVRTIADPISYGPHVAKAANGHLWFSVLDGVSVVDPKHLSFNKLPPPVHIEQLIADRKSYELSLGLELPPMPRELEIQYTALSLVAPEKNQFRFKLEGHDREWQDVGTRRQAFYNDLQPGKYSFRVIAANNSGVWNEKGASLDFSIAPAYWQTNWFRALCVAAVVALLVLLYWLRIRQVAHRFDLLVDARVGERMRIARELHDTLLQSFNAALLRFGTAHKLLATRPEEARTTLETAMDEARAAITEGRQSVQGLRSSVTETNDLSESVRSLAQQLASESPRGAATEVRLNVIGTPRALRPLVRDEIYRIAGEALRNAFRHAEASRIQVQLGYDARRFEVRVRDDGKGIDSRVLAGTGLPGHFGLPGMRERAQQLGGKLTVWSAPESGTEIALTVPGARAYGRTQRA